MKKNSGNSENSGRVGQVVPPRSKKNYEHWHIRINKFGEIIDEKIRKFGESRFYKGNGNLEKGKNGIEHYQMTVSMKLKKTEIAMTKYVLTSFPELQLYLNEFGLADGKQWYCKPSINEGSNRYCKKNDETFIKEIFSKGKVESNEQKKFIQEIEEFHPWQIWVKENVLETEPNDRTIYVIKGEEGAEGKTTFGKWIFTHYEKVVVLSGKGADMKNGIVDYYNKNKFLPKIIIINIPRSCKDFISYSGIEEVKDMFFFSGKYEGGMICGACPHVIVFCNSDLDYEKMSKDRWFIKVL